MLSEVRKVEKVRTVDMCIVLNHSHTRLKRDNIIQINLFEVQHLPTPSNKGKCVICTSKVDGKYNAVVATLIWMRQTGWYVVWKLIFRPLWLRRGAWPSDFFLLDLSNFQDIGNVRALQQTSFQYFPINWDSYKVKSVQSSNSYST